MIIEFFATKSKDDPVVSYHAVFREEEDDKSKYISKEEANNFKRAVLKEVGKRIDDYIVEINKIL